MNEFFLKEMFDKVSSAATNVRALQITIATCCIVGFMGLKNSLKSGWIENRIKVHEYQINYLSCIEKDSMPLGMKPEELEEFNRAKKYFHKNHYTTDALKENYLNLIKARTENVLLVKLPFFNTVFDINDLAVLSGLAFCLILFIALFSLVMNRERLVIVLEFIKKQADPYFNKELAYSLFMTNKILTINIYEVRRIRFIKHLPALIYYFPFTLYVLIVLNDIRTFDFADVLHRSFTMISYAFSGVFALVIFALTILIRITLKATDETWKEVDIEFDKLKKDDKNAKEKEEK